VILKAGADAREFRRLLSIVPPSEHGAVIRLIESVRNNPAVLSGTIAATNAARQE